MMMMMTKRREIEMLKEMALVRLGVKARCDNGTHLILSLLNNTCTYIHIFERAYLKRSK